MAKVYKIISCNYCPHSVFRYLNGPKSHHECSLQEYKPVESDTIDKDCPLKEYK